MITLARCSRSFVTPQRWRWLKGGMARGTTWQYDRDSALRVDRGNRAVGIWVIRGHLHPNAVDAFIERAITMPDEDAGLQGGQSEPLMSSKKKKAKKAKDRKHDVKAPSTRSGKKKVTGDAVSTVLASNAPTRIAMPAQPSVPRRTSRATASKKPATYPADMPPAIESDSALASSPSRRAAVLVLATGGTIASSAASATETASYTVGVGIDTLLETIPELADVANVSYEQFANVSSKDLGDAQLTQLVQRIDGALADPELDGVVITHGTDTLEETAFLLALTVRSPKPVVLVGAMRPATAVSADGPMNLLQGVSLAASPHAAGRGPMIVLADRIGSAFYTTKRHANQTDAFDGGEAGYLGYFIGLRPHFFFEAARPAGLVTFNLDALPPLPRVDILYGHQGMSTDLIDAAVQGGAAGLVIACVGNGSLPNTWKPRVAALIDAGVPVVRTTRTGGGHVTPHAEGLPAGRLNPQKARVLLRLLLAADVPTQQIAAALLG
ncbi:L-asparaginase type II [Robbsia andropogonis]|nr:asparaginase [Robbsia andropogonis]